MRWWVTAEDSDEGIQRQWDSNEMNRMNRNKEKEKRKVAKRDEGENDELEGAYVLNANR